MIFCMNCGKQLPDEAKFCDSCGTATGQVSKQTDRKIEYEGEIHKCPNCGDIIDAYEAVCEACGYEIRGRKASNSIRELADKIQEIEKTRTKTRHNPLKTLYFGQSTTDTDKKIISLISSFPIPNSKEDLYEFIVLSHSNINVDVYDTGGNQFKENDARLAISNAWKAKLEQAYQKAKLVFAGDSRMNDIQIMYDEVHKSIKKARWRTWKILGISFAVVIGIEAIMIASMSFSDSNSEKKEVARLEALVEEIEIALEEGDYKYALMNADNLHYTEYDVDLEKEWEIKRDYYIDKVIEEAEKNGILLEKPVHEDDSTENESVIPVQSEDNTSVDEQSESLDDNSKAISYGFMEGIQPGLDAIKEGIDDIKNIMDGVEITEENSQELNATNDYKDVNPENEFLENAIDSEVQASFIEGYEKADFEKYNSNASENGLADTKIYFEGILNKTELLKADGTVSILGYIDVESNNTWLVQLHFVPAVSETHYDRVIGKKVLVRGVYSGFSGTKQLPVVVLDELLVEETGEKLLGMQKLLNE